MSDSSEKRVALVTGGAKRVGRAIVEKLLREGFAVAFTYHSSEDKADELVDRYRDDVYAIGADLTAPAEAVEHIRDVFSLFADHLDLLVNNASLYQASDLRQTSLETSRRLMAIHFEAPLLLAQSFERMLRASRGHIINMVDLLAERPWPQYMAYCASKAALVNLTLSLARELAPEVTVNGIAPGVVEWPPGYPEKEKEKYLKRVPLQRPGTPEGRRQPRPLPCHRRELHHRADHPSRWWTVDHLVPTISASTVSRPLEKTKSFFAASDVRRGSCRLR
jgi:pteridine reductase